MFGTKKSQTQPEPVETIAAQEHKQSIGNQVMEALGVGENGTGLDEESEILMPKQNQRQLEAEGVVKESVCVISKDAVIGGGIDVKGDLMVAGKVMGHISASTVTCVGETSYIEGNVTCNKLRMHGGKLKVMSRCVRRLTSMVKSTATLNVFLNRLRLLANMRSWQGLISGAAC